MNSTHSRRNDDNARTSGHFGISYQHVVMLTAAMCAISVASNLTWERIAEADEKASGAEIAAAASNAAPTRPAASVVKPVGLPVDVAIAGDAATAILADGTRRATVLDADLQRRAEQFLASYNVPYGATVAIDPRTGRVLAMAEHRRTGFESYGLGKPIPAASLAKVLTGAALLDRSDLLPHERVCVRGGKRRLTQRNLEETGSRGRCMDLAEALARSNNPAVAKLALKYLDPQRMAEQAREFGFGRSLVPQLAGIVPSSALYPRDTLGFGQAAAGFGNVLLSPLHAALVAAGLANHGAVKRPRLYTDEPADLPDVVAQVSSAETADTLAHMLVGTTTPEGTARGAFVRNRAVRHALHGIRVAGKTGNITHRDPYRDYSWFIGFAPADAPRIAVASVVVNERRWLTRGHYIAADLLRHYFEREQRAARVAARRR
jgi:cell division protein FtsI/penicillin-binding protein 2